MPFHPADGLCEHPAAFFKERTAVPGFGEANSLVMKMTRALGASPGRQTGWEGLSEGEAEDRVLS